MNRLQLVRKFSSISEIPYSEGEIFLEMFIRKIADELSTDQKFNLPGIGTVKLNKDNEGTSSVVFFTDEGDELIFYIPEQREIINYSKYNLSIGKPVLPLSGKSDNLNFLSQPQEFLHSLESKADTFFSSLMPAAVEYNDFESTDIETFTIEKEDYKDDNDYELADSTIAEITNDLFDAEDELKTEDKDIDDFIRRLEEAEASETDEKSAVNDFQEISFDEITDIFKSDDTLKIESSEEEDLIIGTENKYDEKHVEDDSLYTEDDICIYPELPEIETGITETLTGDNLLVNSDKENLMHAEQEVISEYQPPVNHEENTDDDKFNLLAADEEIRIEDQSVLSEEELTVQQDYLLISPDQTDIPEEDNYFNFLDIDIDEDETEFSLKEAETEEESLVLPEYSDLPEQPEIRISSIIEELPEELKDIPGEDIQHEFDTDTYAAEDIRFIKPEEDLPSQLKDIPDEFNKEDFLSAESIEEESYNPEKIIPAVGEPETTLGSLAEQLIEENVVPEPLDIYPEETSLDKYLSNPDPSESKTTKEFQRVKSLTREFFSLSDFEQQEEALTWEFGGSEPDSEVKSTTREFEEIAGTASEDPDGFTFVKSKKSTYEWDADSLPDMESVIASGDDFTEEIDLKLDDDIFAADPPEYEPIAKSVPAGYSKEPVKVSKKSRPAPEEIKSEYKREQKKSSAFIIVISILSFITVAVMAYYYFYPGSILSSEKVTPVIIERNDRVPVMISEQTSITAQQPVISAEQPSEIPAGQPDNKTTVVRNTPADDIIKVSDGLFKRNNVYYAQVSSWQTKSKADKEVERFRQRGYKAEIQNSVLSSGLWYRILIGEFSSPEEANNFLKTNQ
jgi:cell division protein FtsN